MENEPQTNQNQPTEPHKETHDAPKDTFNFDKKTIEVMKYSAIWAGVAGLIDGLINWIIFGAWAGRMAGFMMGGYWSYNPLAYSFGNLITNIIGDAIFGAIFGFILYKFYPFFASIQKKYLNDKLNNLFKLLFWPGAIGALIGSVFIAPFGLFAIGFGVLIIIAGLIFSRFVYAKGMEKSVGHLFK